VVVKATRAPFGSILEWLLAAAIMAAAVVLGSIAIREARPVSPVVPVIAGESRTPDVPAGVPSRAVSVPILLLGNGRDVRVGDRASDVAARIGGAARLVSESVERGGIRERVTRVYEYAGTAFVLVFEAIERTAEPRIAAIYLP
jgi:hypothetical protein